MDALLWLNAETLKRAPTPLFGRRVKCSALGALSQDYGRCTQHFDRLCLMHVHVTMPQCGHWELHFAYKTTVGALSILTGFVSCMCMSLCLNVVTGNYILPT